MKRLTASICLACCIISISLMSFAGDAPNPAAQPDVPETATLEILRRGHAVEELGTFQAGPEADVHAINAPPEDDSDRWFFTLLVTDDPKFAEACDRIRQDINALKLKGYVLPDKPKESWSHYSVRMVSIKAADKPQLNDSWLAKVMPLLDGRPYPHVVIQPPRNGDYGPNKTIAGIWSGYGEGSDFSKEPAATMDGLQKIIKGYSASRYAKGLASLTDQPHISRSAVNGHAQNRRKIPPPFTVDDEPTDLTQPKKVWPPHLEQPPAPKPLTAAEIRKAIPDAPLSFRQAVLAEQYTTAEEVQDAWDLTQDAQDATKEVDRKPANPTEPTTGSQWDGLVLVVLIGVLIVGGVMWYQRSKAKPTSST
jgi:hypothetical protein